MLTRTTFACLLLVGIGISTGCRETSAESEVEGSQRVAAAVPDSSLPIPEYHGVYAVDQGKLVEFTKAQKLERSEHGLAELDRRAYREDPAALPLLSPGADFLFFPASSGAELPFIYCVQEIGEFEIVEYRSRPVTGRTDLIRLAPIEDLKIGRCAVLTKDNRVVVAEEVFYLNAFEVGDVSTVTSRHEEFKRAMELHKKLAVRSLLLAIGTSCKMYEKENSGAFPPNLESLVASGDVKQEDLKSPYDSRPSATNSFVYVPGHTSKTKGVLVYEDPTIHGGKGAYVLFTDGSINWLDALTDEKWEGLKWLNIDELQKALKETQDGTAPASPRPRHRS